MTSLTLPRVTSSPPVGVASAVTKHTVRIALGDSTELLPRGTGKQVFRPESVCLEFIRHDGTRGGWVVQRVEVSGTQVKQDGARGKGTSRRDYAEDLSKAPWWLTELVSVHIPRELVAAA